MSWYISTIIVALFGYCVLAYGYSLYGFLHTKSLSTPIRKLFYSFSFAVYGGAWIFFCGDGTSTKHIWSFLPLLVGPALAFIFFYRVFIKILLVNKRENIASLPDFITKRYGNSKALTALVILFCLVVFIVYIALQIHAIRSIIGLIFEYHRDNGANTFSLFVLLFLAVLVVVIAGRQNAVAEQRYKAIIFTAALSSVLKLLASFVIGILSCYLIYQRVMHQGVVLNAIAILSIFDNPLSWMDFILQTSFIVLAMICLPHLFSNGIAKVQRIDDVLTTRWLLPLYLLLFLVSTLPIIIIGNLSGGELGLHTWIISLPIHQFSFVFSVVAIVGGLAATMGVTIICCSILLRMISTHILLNDQPVVLFKLSKSWQQVIYWLCCLAILLLAYLCHLSFSKETPLTDIGQIIVAGLIQLSPALIGALYWKIANRQGVLVGMTIGFISWFVMLLLPLLLQGRPDSFEAAFLLKDLQKQWSLFPVSYITFCTLIALLLNFTFFIMVSLLSKKRVTEHWQSSRFLNQESGLVVNTNLMVRLEDLLTLVSKFIGEQKALDYFNNFVQRRGVPLDLTSKADDQWIFYTEHLLAKKLGSSIARATVKSAIEGREMPVDEVFLLVNEATQAVNFNRLLLQGALEHLPQGISVINNSMHLVAWNKRYVELFDFPEGFLYVGKPIADILYYNAKRGLCGSGDPEKHVTKRLKWLSLGNPHSSERLFANGQTIEMAGNPMPGGGFVTSFSDITAFRQAEKTLQDVNESLEQRVSERTQALSKLNQELILAKSHAELANESKTRFLAAVSHDLMQPLNAARLFAGTLSKETLSPEGCKLVGYLESSLRSAEELIDDLLDMSRLEKGRILAQRKSVALNDFFETMKIEFTALAPPGIRFRVHPCRVFVNTDSKLLRRILQNFLTNAFRYGSGKVVLGARRIKGHVRIEVWDQGQGIPTDKQQVIFEEFERLDTPQVYTKKGSGLGLAIADGFCKLLNHPLSVSSWLGKGSVFSVTVPVEDGPSIDEEPKEVEENITQPLVIEDESYFVLCVDNEESILIGMETLLSHWGCNVLMASNQKDCQKLLEEGYIPQLALVDYHLDNGCVGTDVIKWLREQLGESFPGVIISADNHPDLIATIKNADLEYLKKPLKPAQLRALLGKYLPLK